MTLLEVMLVLAVIVVAFAIAIPAMRGPLANHRLRLAADRVRAQWGKARIEAMQTGRAHIFRFELGAARCRTEPCLSADDYLESSDADAAESRVADVPLVADPDLAAELPEGVFFLGGVAKTDTRAMTVLGTRSAEPVEADAQWSAPVFFFPDGTSSSAELVLANDRDRAVAVRLRGLTGTALVGPLQTIAEAVTETEPVR